MLASWVIAAAAFSPAALRSPEIRDTAASRDAGAREDNSALGCAEIIDQGDGVFAGRVTPHGSDVREHASDRKPSKRGCERFRESQNDDHAPSAGREAVPPASFFAGAREE